MYVCTYGGTCGSWNKTFLKKLITLIVSKLVYKILFYHKPQGSLLHGYTRANAPLYHPSFISVDSEQTRQTLVMKISLRVHCHRAEMKSGEKGNPSPCREQRSSSPDVQPISGSYSESFCVSLKKCTK
jgi:hypothetical protein